MRKSMFVLPFLFFAVDAPQADAKCGAGRGVLRKVLHPLRGIREHRAARRGSCGSAASACANGACAMPETMAVPKSKVPVKK